MKLKSWMVNKANKVDHGRVRGSASAPGTDMLEPRMRAPGGKRAATPADPEALGPYRTLIGAIREELEQFVTTQLRLHLAIAERDRYLLSSIEVECEEADEHHELLRRFIAEFKPEQIKHYLAREVIAGLRNASAIDLSQFAGLNATQQADDSDERDRYVELLTELRRGSPSSAARPYRVTLLGRWSQLDAPSAADQKAPRRAGSAPTPLAAPAVAIDVEDADGVRSLELASVAAGRRYAVGKGEGCDIVVNGAYASRRHCELWFDKGAWWVADTGSTNGIRVESPNGTIARSHQVPQGVTPPPPIELGHGAWLVLSAQVQGDARQYPRLSLRPATAVAAPRVSAGAAAPLTPVTPIAPPRRRDGVLTITARMASGSRSVDVAAAALPFRVGRSRNQALVIDWAHADVSGRHFEIVALDDSGAQIVVHGDNGVSVDGKAHGPGTQFRWKPGQTLILGSDGSASACALTLSHTP
ncbi:MAG TPA: FHA domain-containing protein [Casimicrobiaceae bacterium]